MAASAIHLVEAGEAVEEVDTEEAYRYRIQIWILRMLLDLKGYLKVGVDMHIGAEALAIALEIELAPGEEAEDAFVPVRLAARLRALEAQRSDVPCAFSSNLTNLAQSLGLSAAEERILEFLLVAHKDNYLIDVSLLLGEGLTRGDLIAVLATLLDVPRETVRSAIRPGAALLAAGLVQLEPGVSSLFHRLKVFSRLLDALSEPQSQPLGMLTRFIDPAPAPQLSPGDFDDYKEDYSLLYRYLTNVLGGRVAGCNVLIHGLPGVGKTQLVRTLCCVLGADLFEVASEDRDGDPLSFSSRMSGFALSQRILSNRANTVLLFDEVEDVFPDVNLAWHRGRRGGAGGKCWMNKLLESNQVPVFWLANQVSQIEPAHLRRFDIVLEWRPMNVTARRALIERYCLEAGVQPGPWIAKAAENRFLSPAIVAKITRVMKQVAGDQPCSEAALFEKLANGTLDAMGVPLLNLRQKTPTLPYEVDLLKADIDLNALIAGLKRNKEGRLLCYGPPGTGKTAFAKHLAEVLGQPLLQFRASDILGPYVGMTERNLGAAFRQAREQEAVMLLDEIDSLLRSREGAHRSWEVTQVNELLVQIEEHEGVLIACTNHKRMLDSAAARRFDVKIGFDYLAPEASWRLFEKVLQAHQAGFERHKQAIQARLLSLRHLTPGDFNAAVRKASITSDGVSALGLIGALEEEEKAKEIMTERGIGFSAAL